MVNNLRYYRLLRGYSQKELAYICDTDRFTISRIENNKHMPNCELLLKLIYALQANIITLNYNDFLIIADKKKSLKKRKR